MLDYTLRVLPKLFPPLLPSQTCFVVPACRGFWKTRVIRECGTFRKSIQTLAAQPRTAWALADFLCLWISMQQANFVSDCVDSKDLHLGRDVAV